MQPSLSAASCQQQDAADPAAFEEGVRPDSSLSHSFPNFIPIPFSHIHPGLPSHQSINIHWAMACVKHLPTSNSSLAVLRTEHQSFSWPRTTPHFWECHCMPLSRIEGKEAAFDPLVPHPLLLLNRCRAPLATACTWQVPH